MTFARVWIVVIIFLLLIVCWLLIAPLELRIDTRTPQASVKWITVGKAVVLYENEKWLLKLRVLFFSKQWQLEKLFSRKKKKKKRVKQIDEKARPRNNRLRKLKRIARLIKTLRVAHWRVALDTGDPATTALLYPLNFLPDTRGHFYINFQDESYLTITVRDAPWKLAYAFFR